MFTQKIVIGGLALALILTGVGCKNKNEAQFVIPELGLDLTLPRTVAEDLTYQIREERGDKIIMLNSKKLLAAAPSLCDNKLGLGPIGNIYRQIRLEDPTGGPREIAPGRDHKVGDYHLSYLKPITLCAPSDELKALQTTLVTDFEKIWRTLDTSGLPQKFTP